ncbi:AraC family transcriptional regulator [Humitalea sp. 24SJ18S-53]|uniref:AraC family transcriptional regulator n=1 Tax=Humitalea sp. 24SJ18S-53 TaxID=3422307 RepID=UPI003D67019F
MEILSETLGAVRLAGAMFREVTATPPWVMDCPPMQAVLPPGTGPVIGLHALLSGACWAEFDPPAPALRLRPGDLLLVVGGVRHRLCSAPGLRPGRGVAQQGDGGVGARFVCGSLGCAAVDPLLDALPRILLSRGRAGWVAQLLRQALGESQARRRGCEIVLARLGELLVVEALRGALEPLPQASSPGDRHVAAALRLIHARPAEAWTLARLARDIGMSRSVLAERFARIVHVPPMHYLGQWRLRQAARLLRQPGVSVAQVAEQVGYTSDAAFSRAFKKLTGSAPGAWRRGPRQNRAERLSDPNTCMPFWP